MGRPGNRPPHTSSGRWPDSYVSLDFESTFRQKSGSSCAVHRYSVHTSSARCASDQVWGTEVNGFSRTTGSMTVI